MARLLVLFPIIAGMGWAAADSRFEIAFPASVHAQPITGRVFVVLSRRERP